MLNTNDKLKLQKIFEVLCKLSLIESGNETVDYRELQDLIKGEYVFFNEILYGLKCSIYKS